MSLRDAQITGRLALRQKQEGGTSLSVIPAFAGIQSYSFWIPGLALLARNDGLLVFVIPAQPVLIPLGTGIQEYSQ